MKTITITKDEYKNAVADAVLELTTGDKSEKDPKLVMVELMIASRFSTVLETKLFGEDKDE